MDKRSSAFVAITLATVAVTTCLITMPMMFHYVQRVESGAQQEIDWCYKRSRDMWRDMVSARRFRQSYSSFLSATKEAVHRQKRAASAAAQFFASKFERRLSDDTLVQFEDAPVLAFQGGSCCTCQRGPPGPPGAPGTDGRDGVPGNAGDIGAPGDAVPLRDEYFPKFPEQCPCEAAKGPEGVAGPRGSPGQSGNPGGLGKPGDQGRPGEPGDAGQPGRGGELGRPGPPGPPGEVSDGRAGPAGPAGRPGPKGPPGESGAPGNPGSDGDNGAPGQPGDAGFPGGSGSPGEPGGRGDNGEPGATGGCDHCPPPRLAPGY